MRGQIISILIVTALVVGAVIGYFGHATTINTTTDIITRTYTESNTTTETAISTYTITTTFPQVINTTALVPHGVEGYALHTN
jgi:NhaP-type Na+/H+ or K+/H+ antiporter